MRSEADPKFLLQYTDVYVGEPSVEEDAYLTSAVTPFEVRGSDVSHEDLIPSQTKRRTSIRRLPFQGRHNVTGHSHQDDLISSLKRNEAESLTPRCHAPFECRLRDCTYSAPIYVDVRDGRARPPAGPHDGYS